MASHLEPARIVQLECVLGAAAVSCGDDRATMISTLTGAIVVVAASTPDALVALEVVIELLTRARALWLGGKTPPVAADDPAAITELS